MKKMILSFAIIAIFGCHNKEINLSYNNPVDVATNFVSEAFINELLEATIVLIPENGEYPVDYFLNYEVLEGEGDYKLDDEVFEISDMHTFGNANRIELNISYQGSTEGIHRSNWIIRNEFDQIFEVSIAFNLRKNLELVPNEAPVAIDDIFTAKQGIEILLDVLANDTDEEKDDLSIIEIETPENGTAVIDDNKISYVPNDDFIGDESISYTITDGNDNTATGTMTIMVMDKDSEDLAPIATNDILEIEINTLTKINVLGNDNDPEGTELSLIFVTPPANGIATIEGLNIKYEPNQDFEGNDVFEYVVKDSGGLESTASVTISVVDSTPNLAPNTKSDFAETTFETSILIDVVGNDVDNEREVITLIEVDKPTNGTAIIENNQIRYTPDLDYSGGETFSYTIKDESENTSKGDVSIIVKEKPNLAPVAENDQFDIEVFEPTLINVLMNDEDPENDAMTIVSVTQPLNGTVTLENNEITYQANLISFVGSDSFTYTVKDSSNNESIASVIVNVSGQFVRIKNAKFEQQMILNKSDSDGIVNGKMLLTDVLTTQDINIQYKDLGDFTDYQYFTNIQSLSLSGNDLTEIDLSNNPKLVQLYLNDNNLTSLDISENPNLKELNIWDNPNLERIFSNNVNTVIEGIYSLRSNLEDFDGRNFPNLSALYLESGSIKSVDLSNNPKLDFLILKDNLLENIDFSGNPILNTIDLDDNRLKNLDLRGTKTKRISCENNNLLNINANGVTELENIKAGRNALRTMDLRNIDFDGHNAISALDNAGLDCIAVDDPNLVQSLMDASTFKYKLDNNNVFKNTCN